MRAHHTSHSLPSFPVYSSTFISEDRIVLGGGGGATRTGIKNKLRLYETGKDKIQLLDELELEPDEDVPMSIAGDISDKNIVCGINSSTEKLNQGQNDHCRLFSVKGDKLKHAVSRQTIHSKDLEVFQKVTTLSPDRKLLAIGGSNNEVTLLSYPSLTPLTSSTSIPSGDLYDATFTGDNLLVTSSEGLFLFDLPTEGLTSSPSKPKSKGKRNTKEKALGALEIAKKIDKPPLPGQGNAQSTFRAAVRHPHDPKAVYTALNTVASRGGRGNKTVRRGYVCKWDTDSWEATKKRKVVDAGITCFAISADGKLLAYGSSDYTIGILDSTTLAPLLTILKAHDFPPTNICFNPSATLLVSGSPDNTIRVIEVPATFGGISWVTIILIFTLLVCLAAVLAQRYIAEGKLF